MFQSKRKAQFTGGHIMSNWSLWGCPPPPPSWFGLICYMLVESWAFKGLVHICPFHSRSSAATMEIVTHFINDTIEFYKWTLTIAGNTLGFSLWLIVRVKDHFNVLGVNKHTFTCVLSYTAYIYIYIYRLVMSHCESHSGGASVGICDGTSQSCTIELKKSVCTVCS